MLIFSLNHKVQLIQSLQILSHFITRILNMFTPVDSLIKQTSQIHVQTDIRQVFPYQIDPKLPSNQIFTSKYTCLTFIPLNLIQQFSKPPNLYFLMIGLLQMIPSISPTEGIPTMYIPLTIISVISALKDLYEDRQRSISDRIENNREYTRIMERGQAKKILSKDIKVGMLIKVLKNQIIPCDGLLLSMSQGNNYAFVSTSSLDGETHLKRRSVHKSLYNKINEKDSQDILDFSFSITCQQPNPNFHQFEGMIHYQSQNYSINQNNVLFRGTKLKNTEDVILLVLYTGKETKVLLNMSLPHAKKSTLQKQLRVLTLAVFACIVILSCTFAFLYQSNYKSKQSDVPHSHLNLFVTSFFSWVLNLTNLIPISLLVTLESICLIQGKMITNDSEMNTNDFKPLVNTSNMIEQMGVIDYVASDKTGTLTKNELKVKKISNGTNSYGYQSQIVDRTVLQLFSICHTCYVNSDGEFESISQDQIAILQYCKSKGLILKNRDQSSMTFQNKGFNYNENQNKNSFEIEIVHNIQFTSQRKRQSIIYTKNNKHYIVTKGSDDTLAPLSISTQDKSNILNTVISFAKQGLRTILISYRQIPSYQYKQWVAKLIYAKNNNFKQQIIQLEKQIQNDLEIVGVVGIQDQLQDNVIQVVQSIVNAGIQFMIISGDRPQTVMSIAGSLKLQEQPFLCPVNQYLPQYSNKKFLVFARCTPGNKKSIVENISGNVLAIGDGANDVSMLTCATFGVGIAGKEGKIAAQSADIAISQFQHLRRLLFLYGRETYRKNSYLLIYNFYKNILYTLPQIMFGFYSNYTSVAIYEKYLNQFYNTIFTSAVIFLYCLFDKTREDHELLSNENNYYQDSKSQSYFSLKAVSFSLLQSAILGAIAAPLCFYFLGGLFSSPTDFSIYEVSSIVMLYVIIYANIRIVSLQTRMNLTILLVALGSIASYILFFMLMIELDLMDSYNVGIFFDKKSLWVLAIVLTISAATSYVMKILEECIGRKPSELRRSNSGRMQLIKVSDSDTTRDTVVELAHRGVYE